jgi:hypothetical protein
MTMNGKGYGANDRGLIEVLSLIFVRGTEKNLDEEPQDIRTSCEEPNTPPPEHKSAAFRINILCVRSFN